MVQKLSKCEILQFSCQPHRFCMKSNFGGFKLSKMSFSELLNFDFSKFEPFFKSQICQNSEIVKLAILEIQNLPQFNSRKIEGQICKFSNYGPLLHILKVSGA